MTFSATKNRVTKAAYRGVYPDSWTPPPKGCSTLYAVTGVGGWNSFLNDNGVSIRNTSVWNLNTIMTVRRTLTITTPGNYTITASSDDTMTLKVGPHTFITDYYSHGCGYCSPFTAERYFNAGTYLIEAAVDNGPGGNQGIALSIKNSSTLQEVFNFRNELQCFDLSALNLAPCDQLYKVTYGGWDSFWNTYGVSVVPSNQWETNTTPPINRNVYFPVTGNYTFQVGIDDNIWISLDGEPIIQRGIGTGTYTVAVTAGNHVLTVVADNGGGTFFVWGIVIRDPSNNIIWDTASNLDCMFDVPLTYRQLYAVDMGPVYSFSSFMRDNAVWVGPTSNASIYNGIWWHFYRKVTIPTSKTYTLRVSMDNAVHIAVDGARVLYAQDNYGGYNDYSVFLSAGQRTFTFQVINFNNGATVWNNNPAGLAFVIYDGATPIYSLRNQLAS